MATTIASRPPSAPLGIVRVFGCTCATAECGYHESLHTADLAEAVRTAKELGWRSTPAGLICPLCVAASEPTNGHSRRAGSRGAA